MHAHGVGSIGLQACDEAAHIAGDALVRIEAEHPVMRQLGARHVEQETAVPAFRALPRIDVLFPGLIGDDQRDLGVLAQDVDRVVGARIVIGDDRVDLGREIVERVGQDQRLVADARHGDELVLAAEQRFIALDHALRGAELPIA